MAALSDRPAWVLEASPKPGRPLGTHVERFAVDIRRCVEEVAERLSQPHEAFATLFTPRVSGLGFSCAEGEAPRRLSRALIAEWLIAYSLGAVDADSTLADAEVWFHGGVRRHLPQTAPATRVFARPPGRVTVHALLPYLLDSLRPGTRREVIRDRKALLDRRSRKRLGVFYTPADVAQNMIARLDATPDGTCLDPACGTGVFLRAAVANNISHPRSVFGCDIDGAAIEGAVFVVLLSLLARARNPRTPLVLWHELRQNFASLNALTLHQGAASFERRAELAAVARVLARGEIPLPVVDQEPLSELGSLFPVLSHGTDFMATNPPYASLGDQSAVVPADRFASYASGVRSTLPVETAFVELGWQLTSLRGQAAFVLPLAVATSTRLEFAELRRAIQAEKGAWRFEFFDRAPDALFGDDVKTRNVIVTYDARSERSISTTPLRRWTSRTRLEFLEARQFAEIRCDIVGGVPKLGTEREARLYELLRARSDKLIGDMLPRRAAGAAARGADSSDTSVFVAPTAYNWLGVARDMTVFSSHGHTSNNRFSELKFPNQEMADVAFALISSRLVYWLWRVEGDGFHVARAFIERLPFSLRELGENARARLAQLGDELWHTACEHPVVSVNRGRTSVAFPTVGVALLDTVDEAVSHAFRIDDAEQVCGDVRRWHQNLVVVDFGDHRRLERATRRGVGSA